MTAPFSDDRPQMRIGLTKAQKVWSVIGIALVVMVPVAAVMAFALIDSPEDAEADAAAVVVEIETTEVGVTVTDGGLEFAVGNVEQGAVEILKGAEETAADGEFVFIDLTVTNLDDQVFAAFDGSYHKLVDTAGNEYAVDTDAAAMLLGNEITLAVIPAGGQVEGRIAFDVPPGTEPAMLELHEGAGGGVQVPLR
jgi:hypothetical protein